VHLELLQSAATDKRVLLAGLDWIRERNFNRYEEVTRKDAEIARLKDGDLTPEEFQNLCHRLDEKNPGCTREDFEEGCKIYQEHLFGQKKEKTTTEEQQEEKEPAPPSLVIVPSMRVGRIYKMKHGFHVEPTQTPASTSKPLLSAVYLRFIGFCNSFQQGGPEYGMFSLPDKNPRDVGGGRSYYVVQELLNLHISWVEREATAEELEQLEETKKRAT